MGGVRVPLTRNQSEIITPDKGGSLVPEKRSPHLCMEIYVLHPRKISKAEMGHQHNAAPAGASSWFNCIVVKGSKKPKGYWRQKYL